MESGTTRKAMIIIVSACLTLVSSAVHSGAAEPGTSVGIIQNRKTKVDIKEKPQFGYLADTEGNHDGMVQPEEEEHLNNILHKLILRMNRFKRLPREIAAGMNFPKRKSKYGIFVVTDKEFQYIDAKGQIFTSLKEFIKARGNEVIDGYLLRFDKNLDLKNVWSFDKILFKEKEKWVKVDPDSIEINYYNAMKNRWGKKLIRSK